MTSHGTNAELAAVLARLVYPRLGYVPAQWPARVFDVIRERAARAGMEPLAYACALVNTIDDETWTALVAAVTIPHTAFFRHPEQFAMLRAQLVDLFASQRRPLQLWSAGCATGEEAYSLALIAEQVSVPVQIYATDINPTAIGFASRGVYPRSRAERLSRPNTSDGWVAPPSLRGVIVFSVESLLTPKPPLGVSVFDIIFCRNVAIYFARDNASALLRSIAGYLAPWGALVVAPTDALVPLPPTLDRTDVAGWLRRARPQERVAAPPPVVASIPPVAAPPPPARPAAVELPASLELAARALSSGDLHAAESMLRQLLEADSRDARAWFVLGETLVARDESAQARTAFLRAAASVTAEAGEEAETLARAAQRRAEQLRLELGR